MGSMVLFLGNNLVNFGSYLYHFLMGRMLGPKDYGVLSSLISLIYFLGVPMSALSVVVVKYTSAFRGTKSYAAINDLYSRIRIKLLVFGILSSLLVIAFSSGISSFLHFDSLAMVLLVVSSSFIGLFSCLNGAVIQGFLRFGWLSFLGMIQVFLKILISITFVAIGLGVLGSTAALLITASFGYILTIFLINKILDKNVGSKSGVSDKQLLGYFGPTLLSALSFTSLYTIDVIFARHFLASTDAGLYSALATLGKTIFFASGPIVQAMFPIVSEQHSAGKNISQVIRTSFLLSFFVCFGIGVIYFLFPSLVVRLLYGSQYLDASQYLYLFAIFIILYSLCSLLTNFYFSIKEVKVVVFPVIAAVLQAVLICFFHKTIFQIVLVSVVISGLLLMSLLLYHFSRREKRR